MKFDFQGIDPTTPPIEISSTQDWVMVACRAGGFEMSLFFTQGQALEMATAFVSISNGLKAKAEKAENAEFAEIRTALADEQAAQQ